MACRQRQVATGREQLLRRDTRPDQISDILQELDKHLNDPTMGNDVLAELISNYHPTQFNAQADRAEAIDLLGVAIDLLGKELTKLARFKDELAHRQGLITTAPVRLGQGNFDWTVLEKDSDDPSVRTELIINRDKSGSSRAR